MSHGSKKKRGPGAHPPAQHLAPRFSLRILLYVVFSQSPVWTWFFGCTLHTTSTASNGPQRRSGARDIGQSGFGLLWLPNSQVRYKVWLNVLGLVDQTNGACRLAVADGISQDTTADSKVFAPQAACSGGSAGVKENGLVCRCIPMRFPSLYRHLVQTSFNSPCHREKHRP